MKNFKILFFFVAFLGSAFAQTYINGNLIVFNKNCGQFEERKLGYEKEFCNDGKLREGADNVLITGCYCIDGYVRDSTTQNCIPKDQCDGGDTLSVGCSPPNTAYGYGCNENFCSNYLFQFRSCRSESWGCWCMDGFYLSENGDCISKDQCSESFQCGENEIYKKGCDYECFGEEGRKRKEYPCDSQNFGCKCLNEDDYVRDENGNCVTTEECCDSDPDKVECDSNLIYRISPYFNPGCVDGEFRFLLPDNEFCGCYCPYEYYYDSDLDLCRPFKDCQPSVFGGPR